MDGAAPLRARGEGRRRGRRGEVLEAEVGARPRAPDRRRRRTLPIRTSPTLADTLRQRHRSTRTSRRQSRVPFRARAGQIASACSRPVPIWCKRAAPSGAFGNLNRRMRDRSRSANRTLSAAPRRARPDREPARARLGVTTELHRIARHGQSADVDDQATRLGLLRDSASAMFDTGPHGTPAVPRMPATPPRCEPRARLRSPTLNSSRWSWRSTLRDEPRIGADRGVRWRREGGEQAIVGGADHERPVAGPERVERGDRVVRIADPRRGWPDARNASAAPSSNDTVASCMANIGPRRPPAQAAPRQPLPASRPCSAARMAPNAYIPADRSLMGRPGLVGSPPGAPVTDSSPLVPWTTES